MSETVDTRIVEAKFDSAQFEKGVDKTVKKLDELKKSLTFEETGKSVADIASKAQVATSKVSESLQNLENRITSFTGMLKQKMLGGIADEIVGVFFKIKNSFESLVTSLSSVQISRGMQRYTDILTSVRTLVSAGVTEDAAYSTIGRLGEYADQTSYSLDELVSTMSKFKTAGANLTTAQRMVEGLSNAAASMGVNAEQASRAYLNLQQAYSSKVMLQRDWISFESLPMVGTKFNQAIIDAAVKVGTLAADKVDKETGKVLSYKTKKKAGTKITGGKGGITADNLGSMLQYRWFTDEVMEEVFGNTYYFEDVGIERVQEIKAKEREIKEQVRGLVASGDIEDAKFDEEVDKRLQEYFDETNKEKLEVKKKEIEERKKTKELELKERKITKDEYQKSIKALDDELKKFENDNNLTTFAWKAFQAGQEARSLTDVLNTLKDAISRGWATSFEYIFGKLDEAKDFFTWLTESDLANAIYSIATFRNEVLRIWNEGGGRDMLIEGLQNLDEALGNILGRFTIFNSDSDDFEEKTANLGANLIAITRNFKNFTQEVKDWLNADPNNEGVTRAEKIQIAFANLSTVINGFLRVLGIAFRFVARIAGILEPVFDALYESFNKAFGAFANFMDPAQDPDNNVYTRLGTGLDKVAKIVEDLTPIFTAVAGVLGDVFEGLVNLFTGVVSSDISFISNLFDLIGGLLGADNRDQDGKNAIDRIAESITNFGETCKKAFASVNNFLTAVLLDLSNLLGMGDGTQDIFANLNNYFETDAFIADIREWFTQLPDKILGALQSVGNLGTKIWNAVDEFLWGKKVKNFKYNKKTKKMEWQEERIKSGFSKWLDDTFKKIKAFFTDPKKIQELWNTIDEFIWGKKVTTDKKDENGKPVTERVKEGFSKWLDDTITSVKNWIASVPEKITNLWNIILDFIFGRKAEPGEIDPETGKEYPPNARVREGLIAWISNLASNIWTWLKDTVLPFVKSIWDKVFDFIFGHDAQPGEINPETNKEYPPNTKVQGAFITWMKDLATNIGTFINDDILPVVKKVWKAVFNFLFGHDAEPGEINPETNEEYPPNAKVKGAFITWLEGIAPKVSSWLEKSKLVEFVKIVWQAVYDLIFGKDAETGEVSAKTDDDNYAPTLSVKDKFIKWIDDLSQKVGTWFTGLKGKIKLLWTKVLGFIFGKPEFDEKLYNEFAAYDKASGIIPDENPVQSLAKEYERWVTEGIKEEEQNAEGSSTIEDTADGFLQTIGKKIGAVFSNLPTYIVDGIDFGVDLINDLAKSIKTFFEGKNNKDIADASAEQIAKDISGEEGTAQNKFLTAIIGLGQKIATLVTETIPGILNSAFSWVSGEGTTDFTTAIKNMFGNVDLTEANILIENIGTNIAETIKKIPSFIRRAVGSIKRAFSDGAEQKHLIEKIDPTEYLNDPFSQAFSDPHMLISDDTIMHVKNAPQKSGLWSTIKEIGKSIGEALVDLGPDILNGVNGLINWLSNGFTKLTDWLAGYNEEKKTDKDLTLTGYVTKQIAGSDSEDKQKYSALWESATKLGETIKNVITQVIPSFIEQAFTTVSTKIPEILGTLFNGSDNNGVLDTITRSMFGESGGNAESNEDVNETVEAAVENAEKKDEETVEVIEKWIYNRKNLIHELEDELYTLNLNHDANWWAENGFDLATVEGQTALANKKADLEAQLKELKAMDDSVLKVLLNDEGHYSADNGMYFDENVKIYKKRLDAIGDIYDHAEMLAKAKHGSGSGSIITAAMIEAEFTDEDKSKLAALTNMTSEYVIESRDGTYTQVDAATKKYKKSEENILGVLGSFGEIIKSVSESDTVKVVAICVAAMYALSAIRAMLSFSDVLEAPGYIAKWQAIEIAIIGIFGVVGYIMALAHDISQEGVTRLEQTEATFDKIGDFIVKLTEIVKWISIFSMVKAGFGALKTIKEGAGDLGILGTLLTDVIGFGTKGLMVVGGSELIGSAVENIFDSVSSVISDLGGAIDTFMEGLGPAIEKLSGANGSLPAAIDSVNQVATLLQAFYNAFQIQLVPELEKGNELLMSYELKDVAVTPGVNNLSNDDLFASIVDRLAIFLELANVMTKIGDSLKTFETIEDAGAAMKKIADVTEQFSSTSSEDSDFVRFIDNLFEAVWEIVKRFSMAGQLESNIERIDISIVSAAFSILADVMGAFTAAVKDLSTDNVKAFQASLDVLVRITEAFDSAEGYKNAIEKLAKGDASLSKLGREIKNFSLSAKGFFHNLKTIEGFDDSEDAIRTERVMADVIHIAQEFANVTTELNRLTNLNDKIKDFSQLSEMGSHLPTLANNIATFISNLNTILNTNDVSEERVIAIADAASSVGMLMHGLAEAYNSYIGQKSDVSFAAWFGEFPHLFFTTITEMLTGDQETLYGTGFEVGKNFLTGFRKGIQAAINDFKTGSELEKLDSLMYGDSKFLMNLLTTGEYKPTITPVLEISDDFIAKANQMRQMLGFNPMEKLENGDWNTSLNLANAINIPKPVDYTEKLSSIDSRLLTATRSLSGLRSDIQSIQFVINGKDFSYAIGPDIDEYLGRESVYFVRK